jgi:hypothetical protein
VMVEVWLSIFGGFSLEFDLIWFVSFCFVLFCFVFYFLESQRKLFDKQTSLFLFYLSRLLARLCTCGAIYRRLDLSVRRTRCQSFKGVSQDPNRSKIVGGGQHLRDQWLLYSVGRDSRFIPPTSDTQSSLITRRCRDATSGAQAIVRMK